MKNLEDIIKGLLGIPYLHNGRSYSGVDCYGLIYLFFKELGIYLPVDDGRPIAEDWYLKEPERYINGLRQLGEEVGHWEKLRPLDLPYFRLYQDVITHSGVMLDRGYLLHVLINKEVRVDSLQRRFWLRKYAGAIRLPFAEKLLQELKL